MPTAREITPQVKESSTKQKTTTEIIAKNRNRSKRGFALSPAIRINLILLYNYLSKFTNRGYFFSTSSLPTPPKRISTSADPC